MWPFAAPTPPPLPPPPQSLSMPPMPADLAENILLFMGVVAGVKLVAFRVVQRFDIEPPADLKVAERTWHIVFSIMSVRLTLLALSDLDLLQSFDLGTAAIKSDQCATGAAEASVPPASTVTVFLIQICLYVSARMHRAQAHSTSSLPSACRGDLSSYPGPIPRCAGTKSDRSSLDCRP